MARGLRTRGIIGILLILLVIVMFNPLRQKGAFSNMFPNFTSMCLGKFLLPDDQIATVNQLLEFSRTNNCFRVEDHYASISSINIGMGINEKFSNDKTILSLYPLKMFANVKRIKLALGTNDIEPLKYLTNIQLLWLVYPRGKLDITPIHTLSNLEELSLQTSQPVNLSPLSGLKKLSALWLFNEAHKSETTDLSLLQSLPNLKRFGIKDLELVNVEPISNLQSLESIHLEINPKANLQPLAKLKQLKYLDLRYMKGAKCPELSKTDICDSK